jgi:hypothetical protein
MSLAVNVWMRDAFERKLGNHGVRLSMPNFSPDARRRVAPLPRNGLCESEEMSKSMKSKDQILVYPAADGFPAACRLRLFESAVGLRCALVTDLGSQNPGGTSVRMKIESIFRTLVDSGTIALNTTLVEHFIQIDRPETPTDCTFVYFDRELEPSWRGIHHTSLARLLECEPSELLDPTLPEALLREVAAMPRRGSQPRV